MSAAADLLCAALAREIAEPGIRVYAVTSPATAAAGLAARELGAPGLALASGFTRSTVLRCRSSRSASAACSPPGRRCATIHSTRSRCSPAAASGGGGAGAARRPAVRRTCRGSAASRPAEGRAAGSARAAREQRRAVPGLVSAARARAASARRVRRCRLGAAPPPTSVRRLLTPAGCFALGPGGWAARWLTPEGAELVSAVEAFPITIDGAPVVDAPDAEALAAVQRADPHGARAAEFAAGREAAELFARIGALEEGAAG